MQTDTNKRAAPVYHEDPEQPGMNTTRTEWAERTIAHFEQMTGVDREDALADLLSDLMHWSDRNGFDFSREMERGGSNYIAETDDKGTQFPL